MLAKKANQVIRLYYTLEPFFFFFSDLELSEYHKESSENDGRAEFRSYVQNILNDCSVSNRMWTNEH